MFTIAWNPRGFHLITVLEKGRKFNVGDYIAEILEPLSQWLSIESAGNERKLLVYADNARPHTDKLSTQYFNENRMKSAPHAPSPPDLAPSDFYLFWYVKRCLARLSFEDADQLLAVVKGVLEGIEKGPCKRSFSSWMDRLKKCIATNGEYTEYAQINVIEEYIFILPILRCLCPGGTPCTLPEPSDRIQMPTINPNSKLAREPHWAHSRSLRQPQPMDDAFRTQSMSKSSQLERFSPRLLSAPMT
jgi:hypothetical protein